MHETTVKARQTLFLIQPGNLISSWIEPIVHCGFRGSFYLNSKSKIKFYSNLIR